MPDRDLSEPPESVACPHCAAPIEGVPTPSESFPYITMLAHCLACGHEWSIMRLLGG